MINAMLNVEGAKEKYDLSSLRVVLSAGEALPEELYLRWKAAYGVEILDGIGSAEMFHLARVDIPCSSSLSYEFMRPAGDLHRTVVPVLTLDRFVREKGIARVDLVKIDTETTEPEVLAGMADTLKRDHPAIV